jgi:hypothetical protein
LRLCKLFVVNGLFICCGKGVGNIGKGRKIIGITVDESLAATVQKRAAALGITPSRFAAMIAEKWQAEGCPPVSEPDRLMQIAAKAEGAPKTGKRAG